MHVQVVKGSSCSCRCSADLNLQNILQTHQLWNKVFMDFHLHDVLRVFTRKIFQNSKQLLNKQHVTNSSDSHPPPHPSTCLKAFFPYQVDSRKSALNLFKVSSLMLMVIVCKAVNWIYDNWPKMNISKFQMPESIILLKEKNIIYLHTLTLNTSK